MPGEGSPILNSRSGRRSELLKLVARLSFQVYIASSFVRAKSEVQVDFGAEEPISARGAHEEVHKS